MNRPARRPLLATVAALAVVGVAPMMTVGGPAGLLGAAPAGARTSAATPTRCAAGTAGVAGTAGAAGKAGMPGMDSTHVTDTGGSDHSTRELRDRLARTPSGGTLTVPPGVYRGALVIDRPVTLVGVGHPVLKGDGTGTVLTIRAAGTVVRDLMVEGSGPGPVGNPAGVSVQADDVVVTRLHIQDTYTGIWVEGVRNAQILDNVIAGRKNVAVSGFTPRTEAKMAGMAMTSQGGAQAGRGDGISLYKAIRPVVSGNAIADVRDGVYLEYGSGTTIECNSVERSRYALHSMFGKSVKVAGNAFATNESGPVMMYGGPVTLADNVIRDQHSAATGFGVLLLDVGGVRLLRNVLVSNRVGIQLEGPKGDPRPTVVELNTIALNQVGIGLYPTADAVLSSNSLVQNTVQVLGYGPGGSGGDSTWSRNGVGNFWSNYRGYERAFGIGATPHVEGAAAGTMLTASPILLALASSPAFTLLRAVEQRSAGQHPVAVDDAPLLDPRSPSLPVPLPSTGVHPSLGTGLVGGATLAVCVLALLRCTRRRQSTSERTKP